MNVHKNQSLLPYNTFGIDEETQYFTAFQNAEELRNILSDATYKDLPKLVLGGGSNILLTQSFEGIVLKNEVSGIEVMDEDEKYVLVKSGAGVVWHDLVMYCVDHGYAGIENLSLIPGSVGAAPMQNIGAYGVELKSVFHELEALEIATSNVRAFKNAECDFGYRESVFKKELKNQFIILSVTLKLHKKPAFNTSYGAISAKLEEMGIKELSIKAISDAVIAIRQSKLPDPKQIGNAGSFFKNPVVPEDHYLNIKEEYPNVVAYPLENGHYKLAAGWLIDRQGWKGKTIDQYGVHKNQALVLVNYGGAAGRDIFELSESIIYSVKKAYNITLQREVNIY